jgi:hypothetical protein
MECPKCLENYEEENPNKIPRILTECGHTFCKVINIKMKIIKIQINLYFRSA